MKSQHLKFATSYASGLSATKAAIAAGYSITSAGNQGAVLLKNPAILTKIGEIKASQVQAVKGIVTPETVITRINILAETTLNEKVKLSALELLARCLHMFDDRISINQPEPLIIMNATNNEIVMTMSQRDPDAISVTPIPA